VRWRILVEALCSMAEWWDLSINSTWQENCITQMYHISCPTQKLPCPVNHMCTSHSQEHSAQTRWSCIC
jgi:hypothetical protein